MKNFSYIMEDFRNFDFIEKVIVLLDLILNPKATDYPVALFSDDCPIDNYPEGHIFTVRFTDDKMLYIRWI